MPDRIRIAPSILSADFARLGEEIAAVEAVGADWLHVDVMDGRFVPNLTIGPPVVKALRRVTKLPLDVHLMIVEPERYVEAFAKAGSDVITIHAEATAHLQRALAQIRELGKRAGVSLNPHTPEDVLRYVLPYVDLVLVMSVNPGFGGQKFIANTYRKLDQLRDLRARRDSKALIEVDGGVGQDNVRALVDHGADVLVAGNSVFNAKDPMAAIVALTNG